MRKKLGWIVTAGILAGLATSCTSAQKRAQKHLESGNYEEAAAIYERLARSKSKDPEVIEGLKKARQGVISKRLIEVRMARMSGNADGALEQLWDVVRLENEWKEFPTAQTGFTQAEETGYLYSAFEGKLKAALETKFPLRAESAHRRYAPVFASGDTARKFQGWEKPIRQSGKESCKGFLAMGRKDLPYFGEFTRKYCAHFGEEVRDTGAETQAKLAELYHRIEVQGAIQSLPAELGHLMGQELQGALEETPWFDVKGKKKSAFVLKGEHVYQHSKDLVNMVHHYKAKEPYTDYRTVQKTRQIPYQDTEQRMDPVTRQVATVTVTKYRMESYSEQEKVVLEREVDRVYPYNAIKHQQRLELFVAAEGELGPKQLAVDLTEKASREGHQHDLKVTEIGLGPSRPELLDQHAWVKDQLKRVRAQFKEKANALWVSLYCSGGATENGDGIAARGDAAHRCLKAQPAGIPASVNEWYEQNLGLSASAVQAMI